MESYLRDRDQRLEAEKILIKIENYLKNKGSKIYRVNKGYMIIVNNFIKDLKQPLIVYFIRKSRTSINCIGGYGEIRDRENPIPFINCYWLNERYSKKNILKKLKHDNYRSNLFHEIIHYLDAIKINTKKRNDSINLSGIEYTSRPDEYNAYYQQVAYLVSKDFRLLLKEKNVDNIKQMKIKPTEFKEFVNLIKDKTFKGLQFNEKYTKKYIKRLMNLQTELYEYTLNYLNFGVI